MKVFVLTSFVVLLTLTLLGTFTPAATKPIRLTIDVKPGNGLGVTYQGHRSSFDLNLGVRLNMTMEKCPSQSPDSSCFGVVGSEAKLVVKDLETGVSAVSCEQVIWHNPSSRQEDCISLENAFWYGGSEMLYQHWPIKNMSSTKIPYVTGDFAHNPLGGINDNLWFNSEGYSLFVDRNTPLFVRFNRTGDNKFCLSASFDEYPFNGASETFRKNKELKYTFCTADTIKESFNFAIGRWIETPSDVVEPDIIAKPIWSTWARYSRNINATIVENFANEIKNNGFKASHFEIDDMWETCYGEMEFDTKKFPDIASTVRKIQDLGFNVSLWVHPYINTNCSSFSDPTIQGYLIKNATSGKPLVCSWWNGAGGYLDSTNQAAKDHLISKLTKLKETSGINSYKFDSGEVEYIEDGFAFSDSNVMATPNNFTRLYVEMASRMGKGVEVRVGYHTQNLPIFVRMLDKDSNWDYNNGLKTLIPTALHMSIIGFPFILPDMIGGNNYGPGKGLPEKELFIRWLQINVFMPALQFSIVPWDYDEEVVNITKAMVQLHEDYAPVINRLAEEATRTGHPIVRPLWWIAPKDQDALQAEQQFVLGDDVIVAPIVEKGATTRDIYIPEGTWADQLTSGIKHTGPLWLRNYQALLHELPYFIRV